MCVETSPLSTIVSVSLNGGREATGILTPPLPPQTLNLNLLLTLCLLPTRACRSPQTRNPKPLTWNPKPERLDQVSTPTALDNPKLTMRYTVTPRPYP